MTALSLKIAGRRNASAAAMARSPRDVEVAVALPAENEIPITHVTNGVHLPTWSTRSSERCTIAISERTGASAGRRGGLVQGRRDSRRGALASAQQEQERASAAGARPRPFALDEGGAQRGAGPGRRRFARPPRACHRICPALRGYKRATLILSDLPRLKKMLFDPWRPVQLVFAGKAHPADDGGKALIQQVYQLAKNPSSAAASPSSRTTTCTSRATSCRAWTCGSIIARASRGLRHLRREGRGPTACPTSRCSTAGGRRASTRQRLADRPGRRPRAGRRPISRRRRHLPHARGKDRASVL